MMSMNDITTLRTIRMVKAVTCVLLLTGMPACDSSDEFAAPEQPVGSMAVSISIMTGKTTGTRAVNEYDRTGTEKENAIDVANGDYRVLLFHKDGWLVRRFKEITPATPDGNGVNRYLITDTLDITLLDFHIAVLANWEQNGWHYPLLAEGVTTISSLMADMRNLFDVKSGWQPFDEDGADGKPATGGVPMFGMHSYTVSEADAKRSTKDNPVDLAPTDDDAIWMMRSMAKIEVVDAMDKIGYSSYPKLESVTFGPYMGKGKLIPDARSTGGNALWTNNSRVTAPSLPAGIVPTDGRLGFFHTLDTDRTNDEIPPIAYTDRDVMAAYVTEQDLTDGRTERPYMVVTVRNRPAGEDGDGEETVTFRLDIPADMTTKLLRNHIYRFEIKSASANLININYVVCPWIEHKAIDLPAFD